MIDANKLNILKLPSTASKIFIYNKKAYFLPDKALRQGNILYLIYMSNINRALNNLVITKSDIDRTLENMLEYVFKDRRYLNKVYPYINIIPRDVFVRNYDIYISNDNIDIKPSNDKGNFNINRFTTCNIYVLKNEGYQNILDTNITAKIILGEVELPEVVLTRTNQTQVVYKAYKIIQYADLPMQLFNPALAYDILNYRKFIDELYKYFIPMTIMGKLPILLIIIIVVVMVLVLSNTDLGSIFGIGSGSK
jgi:hypothetical protein